MNEQEFEQFKVAFVAYCEALEGMAQWKDVLTDEGWDRLTPDQQEAIDAINDTYVLSLDRYI